MDVSLLLLVLPAALVFVTHLMFRRRPKLARALNWIVVAAAWALAVFFWIRYAGVQTDVGLMVEGILAFASSFAALLATLVAAFLAWRRSQL